MILDTAPEVLAPYAEKSCLLSASGWRWFMVRQSTAQQVLNHEESTRLQYGLVSRAQALGLPEEMVLLIDDDLGKSAASSSGRVGFQRLVSEVSLGHVGMILGVEMSRLARSSKDWHQLLEICALFGTLITAISTEFTMLRGTTTGYFLASKAP